MFKDAKHAIRWSETRLTNMGLKSPMASLMKRGQVAAGDLNASELDDIAQTVTAIAHDISPPKGPAMMAIYGISNPERDMLIADAMVLYNRHNLTGRHTEASEALSTLSDEQHTNLMRCVIMSESRNSFGLRKIPLKRICEICNISVYLYKKNNIAALFRISQGMLNTWIDDAARQLEAELSAIDMLND